ncbi:hypothetical protein BRADI_1g51735v3 [Brachypodium distachyon]|uniref:Uncharacterized protein n=1 Tax=Brachypodium distachyon TaxID=15368 RepID=A0A0Q3LA14_BRADI|nr:hypothetical protein BRADI_1g51735v3 [Brachypodium distachyon]
MLNGSFHRVFPFLAYIFPSIYVPYVGRDSEIKTVYRRKLIECMFLSVLQDHRRSACTFLSCIKPLLGKK